MSDRINYIIVTLEEDRRDDDCEATLNAIRNIKGVLDVTPNVAEPSDHMAEMRAKQELWKKLWEAAYPKKLTPGMRD